MWVSKNTMIAILNAQSDLERRVKRLELMSLKESRIKMASLSDEKAGTDPKELLTVEKILDEGIDI